ncbi:23S rRNA (guanosine(2251)-2'-O)-methyltransferase RlmB [Desulfosarcina ovata]|uniref:23S rRNA (Guanosine(2251)-2'-O)-methyltransferase RlmB n=1 Tax=Desulfosarcina ovata subsp. ovata TaxID=2752305 RepID=A0A5K8ALB3_9BACT|nr:23S rRNA (guanosine(2251)-2'-O)-methyltransferase RlmB [Desulfosarcina ovata]BBO93501.1 23S rRNA (guanosine(2251)-2'-O)-methyltransferase RlmB [Desulfosarcina ovata subsp. ovata]
MVPKNRQRRPGPNAREVLYGFHPVMEALMAGRRRINAVMMDRQVPSERQGRVIELAQPRGIPVQTVTVEALRAACGSDHHQGVAMTASPLPMATLESLSLPETGGDGSCLLVLLDSIKDPHNLGAIVRSAHCAGVDALVIPKDRAAGATPAVSKASAGALEHTRLCQVTNLTQAIEWLKKKGVWVAGLAMEAQQTVFQADLQGPLALVVGGEEKGLRPLVRQACDFLVSIPLCGRVDSLNASAAAAVVLFETYRQRHEQH